MKTEAKKKKKVGINSFIKSISRRLLGEDMVFDFPLSVCDAFFSLVTCFSGIKRENERDVWEEEKEEVCGRPLLVQMVEENLFRQQSPKLGTYIVTVIIKINIFFYQ